MIFIRVDFPAPFSPTMACTSPGMQSSETSSSTVVPKKRLLMCRMDNTDEADSTSGI